ncbi:MAG: hypothetical protein AAF456_06740 [Planctomycetota bacterium]
MCRKLKDKLLIAMIMLCMAVAAFPDDPRQSVNDKCPNRPVIKYNGPARN